MFETMILVLVVFPVLMAAVRVPAWLAERAAAKRWQGEGSGELVSSPMVERSVTKAELLRTTSERVIDSARRVVAARRCRWEAAQVASRVEVLVLGEVRRAAKSATDRAKRSAAAAKGWATRRAAPRWRRAARSPRRLVTVAERA